MKVLFILLLTSYVFTRQNRSEQEFIIQERDDEPQNLSSLISTRRQQINTNQRPANRNSNGNNRSNVRDVQIIMPKLDSQNSNTISRGNVAIDNSRSQQTQRREVPQVIGRTQSTVIRKPVGPRFISFGVNRATDLQYQGLLSKILNFGMLSMFTDLTDQGSKIYLMLVLKQDRQVAGKDVYKVIYRVDNPKYVTGSIYYGAEFAVNAGITDPNPNQIDFISFGKSVMYDNLLGLLSIDHDVGNNRTSLDFINTTQNSEGLDFNGQSKSAMVEFIQTIMSLTQSEVRRGNGGNGGNGGSGGIRRIGGNGGNQRNRRNSGCNISGPGPQQSLQDDNMLIGASDGESDLDGIGGDRI